MELRKRSVKEIDIEAYKSGRCVFIFVIALDKRLWYTSTNIMQS